MPSPTPYVIVWLSAAAIDRRRIVRYIAEQSRDAHVAVAFMDALMGKIDLLALGTVQFKPGRLAGTREYVVHPNYIVVYRIKDATRQVQIIRLSSVWNQPD
ncbi:MAG: type II toxin-antitoxin system RelE/ParE family toxin [Polaromonas sp.]